MPEPSYRHPRAHGPPWKRGSRFRPPWWPENEPFPPTRRGAWHGMRRHFIRRAWLMLAAFLGLVFLASGLAVAVLAGAFGVEGQGQTLVPGTIFGLILLAVVFAVAARVVRRMLGPVGEVMEAADRVAAGDYSVRLQERGSREMRRLGRSFNVMAERLAASEEQRRNLLADITHELRTPLSAIRGDVEGMIDGVYAADPMHLASVLEETRVMSRLLEDLQTLSMAEGGALRLHREEVEPGRLVEDAVAAFLGRADAAGVSIGHRVGPGLPLVDVDSVRIGEVLSNLLQNALRHTPSGGSVEVSAANGPDGRIEIAVRDTGSGIPPETLPHVFDRFVKAPDSGGAGLGLAIARSLVEAHGGEITAESRAGEGTTIRFSLPAQGGRGDAGP